MSSKSKPELKMKDRFHNHSGKCYESWPRFITTEYQDFSPFPQRSCRWYNGSLMGKINSKDSTLFGPKGRLRALHAKITSQETPGNQSRARHYRFVGDLLTQFFSFTILDPIVEDLVSCETLRLPQAMDEAVSVVLAAIEMFLRKNNRMILKDCIIADISYELGLEINRQKLVAAKWLLAKGGFWHEHLYEINTATYDILQNLVLDVITNFSFPVKRSDEMTIVKRQVYRESVVLISRLAEARRHPQTLEIYAHVIVSTAAEALLHTPIQTSKPLGNAQFNKRVNRAKRQFKEMLGALSES
ncbi:MAG: hypothetical protein ACE5OZ_00335 [Candidatus Heimdallarchaeota archaeon]